MKVLVFGESCKDVFHYGDCSRLCPDAPVPVFKLINTVETWGMAKNVERNLLSLGAKVDLITSVNCRKITKTRYMDNRTNHMFLRKYCLDQILLHERDVDMQKCVRPRSYPRLRGITRHSDYFESAEEWEK